MAVRVSVVLVGAVVSGRGGFSRVPLAVVVIVRNSCCSGRREPHGCSLGSGRSRGGGGSPGCSFGRGGGGSCGSGRGWCWCCRGPCGGGGRGGGGGRSSCG